MNDPLYVHPDGVRSYAQIHDEVVAGLSQLMGTAAPEAAGVQTSHGAIAAAVSAALSGVLVSRQGTLQATGTSGSTISELLQKAAQMYERGDQKGAATLRAAADLPRAERAEPAQTRPQSD
jgi:3-deoxy-D-arabino-heptulosonate 7-phosphate (DAHP) synthase